MRGSYLYAVLAGEPHLHLSAGGLPDGTSEVSGVTASGLTALISPYEGPAFDALTREKALAALVVHQRVIEGAMDAGPLLPVKFGAVLDSPAQVRDLLTRFGDRLRSELDEVGDAREIDLSATWDVRSMLGGIAQEPAVARLTGAIASVSPEDTLGASMQVGRLVQETLEQRRDEYRQRVVGELAPLARDVTPQPRPTDDIVLNVAFLVERADLDRFEAAVDQLGEALADSLTFRYVGPLPPYSFALVQLRRPDWEEIESARTLLGLGERASGTELREAYRRLAAERHPDRNPNDPSAGDDFARLASAHDVLRAYMRLQGQGGRTTGPEETLDLRPDTVRATVLLDIARADIDSEPSFGAGP